MELGEGGARSHYPIFGVADGQARKVGEISGTTKGHSRGYCRCTAPGSDLWVYRFREGIPPTRRSFSKPGCDGGEFGNPTWRQGCHVGGGAPYGGV